MIITEINFFPSKIELKKPFVISLGPLTHAENLFVRIRTDTGLEGWGEASPFPTIHGETLEGCAAIGKFLANQLRGKNPGDHELITRVMDRAIHGNRCVKSAFDIACYDLASQAANLPLYRYLGGTTNRQLTTDYTVSLGEAETMAEDARAIQQAGFSVIKVKLGRGASEDIARIKAIRRAVGPAIPLRIDANQGWSFAEAVTALQGLAEFNIQHCEAPINRYDWTRLPALRKLSPIPLMADESCWDEEDARRLIKIGAVDSLNIKLSKSGGLTRALRIAKTAGKLPLQVGGFLESRLGFTAAAHFALASPGVIFCDFDTPLMQRKDVVTGGIIYGTGGTVTVPESPGLGAVFTG